MRKPSVASILLVDADLASRLAIKSLLMKAGYAVDSAATTSEAIGKLDRNQYQLVLADLRKESDEAGSGVLAYARQKDFRPATALINSDLCELLPEANGDPGTLTEDDSAQGMVRISDDNVSYLLGRVAELIGSRADRRMRLALRAAS